MLVEYGTGTTLFKAAKLKIELEKELGCRVDLVSPDYLHPRIKKQIARDQIRIL
jgi:predicted nucleotidyltransferase